VLLNLLVTALLVLIGPGTAAFNGIITERGAIVQEGKIKIRSLVLWN
jgi:hypothetical protein